MTDLWANGANRVVTLPPSRDDLYVSVMLLGQVVLFRPITEYDWAVRVAETFARSQRPKRPFIVKVMSLTGPEAQTLGLLPDSLFQNSTPEQDAEMQQRTYDTCMEVLRTSTDPVTRGDAIELLRSMGALK